MSAAIIVATLVALGVQAGVVARAGFLMGDFRAFYCAARVASIHENPYHTEPLRSCEINVVSKRFLETNAGVTIPAPLPGYALAVLIPFSLLPFAVAEGLWAILLLIACAACVWALTRVVQTDWDVGLAVFGLSLIMLTLPFGEVVPLALACICIAGLYASRGRWVGAALFALGAMVEPHLGLPVCVALLLWAPASRLAIGLGLVGLATVSVVALGPSANVEYFSTVLPAHALSEITRDTQYSLSAILAAIGVPQLIALRAGALWYLAMIVLGAIAARSLAKKTENAAFLAFVPPAFAVFGGTFIHITQIAAALPAALLLARYATRQDRTVLFAALIVLAVPWGWAVSPALIIAPAFPVAYLAWRYWSLNVPVILGVAIAATLLLLGLQHLYGINGPHWGIHTMVPPLDARLPEASWRLYSQSHSNGSLAAWAVRFPTWIALAALLLSALRVAGMLKITQRTAAVAALAACCTIVPLAGQMYGDRSHGWLMVDFRAYYCAALAQREHANPYFAQPLHDCEATTPAPYYRAPANVTVPAPYPPYVLAFLTPLTLLPFGAAAILWWCLLAGAIGIGAYALARVSAQPFIVAWAALALSAGLTAWSTGNMLPIAVAGLIVAALAAQRQDTALAVLAICITAVEPHLAVPAAIGLFVGVPTARTALALGAAVLGVLSIGTTGVTQTLSYVTAVLPAHALSEVARDNQYSLSTVVAALGFSDATAVALGTLSYALMVALGVVVGLRLSRRYGDPALTVLMPPAFALLGGSFVHTPEIAAAIPAALLLFARADEYRPWLFAAVLLLALPWMMATSAAMFLAPIFPAAYLTYELWHRDGTRALIVALASFAIIAGLFTMSATHSPWHAAGAHLRPPIDPHLAESSWRTFVLRNTTNRPVMWLLRLPTWIGLFALAIPALLLARGRRFVLTTESV